MIYRKSGQNSSWTTEAWKNGLHFADEIFKCIFLKEKYKILNAISLKYVCKGLIEKKSQYWVIPSCHELTKFKGPWFCKVAGRKIL